MKQYIPCEIMRYVFFPILFILFFYVSSLSAAEKKVRLFITSNMQAASQPAIENQEETDPLLLLGQSILAERKKGADLYLDLGNSFYPGVLSKYSFGAVIMDFYTYFNATATVVSSKDLALGLTTLEFLQQRNATKLLSANIWQKEQPVFTPYIIREAGDKKIAFIALSSKKILFDIAEKNIYNMYLEDEKKILTSILEELSPQNINAIILLSGMNRKQNFEILQAFPDIDLVISGGDNNGDQENLQINRSRLLDGRSILTLPSFNGYYLVDLAFDDRISIVRSIFKPLSHSQTKNRKYLEFVTRLTRWKTHYNKEVTTLIAQHIDKPFLLDLNKAAHLVLRRYDAEVAILRQDSLKPLQVTGAITSNDIIASIQDNYALFTYTLEGNDLLTVKKKLSSSFIVGIENERVQGYPVDPGKSYKVVSTQIEFEAIEKLLNKKVTYTNEWNNLTDLVLDDLKDSRYLLKEDYSFKDRKWRATVDLYLSNFFENARVETGDTIDTPPGKSSESYRKWGIEDKIDFRFYNKYHNILITPYIFYVRQDDQYLQNLLRGTLLYSLHLAPVVNPYHKSQIDSVVVAVDDERPTIIRETVGLTIDSLNVAGKIGIGFEKQVHDPVDKPFYGLESLIGFKYDFLSYFTYFFNLDTFLSTSRLDSSSEDGYIRSEIENRLFFAVNNFLGISFRYKWFYYYSMELEEKYTNAQTLISFDLKTNFKIY